MAAPPHAADNTLDWPRRFAGYFADNLGRWRAAELLRHLVEG